MLKSLAKIVGEDELFPTKNGLHQRYINLDNAASTPALETVFQFIQAFMPHYSSVHRGAGVKSKISTDLYDRAHEIVGEFVGANLSTNTVIFTKNTTEAINKLAQQYSFEKNDIVLTTEMEHHSNDLPWRNKARTIHIKTNHSGSLDLDDLKLKLRLYHSRIVLVCVSGASNVTGIVQPIHEIAEMAHKVGAKLFVDAAQLAPHRKIEMLPDDDPRHIDFIAFSGHKMYAPFGSGVLIGPKEFFLNTPPKYSGGGTVASVTLDDVVWAGLPDREEAGSPNVIGAVSMAKALKELLAIGMKQISDHEHQLCEYALEQLQKIPGLILYGDLKVDRVGVISFNMEGFSHEEVATYLSTEFGIGVRNGCFCAHPYVVKLLGLSNKQIASWRNHLLNGDKSAMPGLVRISFGCYNTKDDIDILVKALRELREPNRSKKISQNWIEKRMNPEYLTTF